MSSCTENEANHYGRFLCSILQISMRWHKDVKVFEEECAKYPGFVTKFSEKDPVHIDYESYRHVCHKWHYRLTKAFILCLDSSDYIQIRNSLIVLTKLLPYFPVMISFAQAIERRLENIRNEEKEKRPDLFVLATGYSGQLKLKKGTFIPESEFHEKESKKSMQPHPPPSSSQHEPTSSKSSSEQVEEKKEKSTTSSNDYVDKSSSSKSKQSRSSHSNRSSNVPDMDSAKKEPKSDYKSSIKRLVDEKPIQMVSSISKEVASALRTDSRASSASSSPKRTEYSRSKDDNDEIKDYKKRKLESKVSFCLEFVSNNNNIFILRQLTTARSLYDHREMQNDKIHNPDYLQHQFTKRNHYESDR